MNVPFLSLHDVTAMHGEEIREAARRVIDSGWYLQGKENEVFEQHYADYIGSCLPTRISPPSSVLPRTA